MPEPREPATVTVPFDDLRVVAQWTKSFSSHPGESAARAYNSACRLLDALRAARETPAVDGDLRDRYAKTAAEWALMYPLANWPWLGRHVGEDEHLDAIARNLAEAWGRDISDRMVAVRDDEVDRLRGELAEAREERDLAIAHDRQPYPTAWAYEQACKALETQRQRAEQAEDLLRVAHDTSNRSEVKRARAVQRAEEAEDRLRAATDAYARLQAQADDAAAARDRWQARARQAEERCDGQAWDDLEAELAEAREQRDAALHSSTELGRANQEWQAACEAHQRDGEALMAALERARVELEELDSGTSLAVDLELLDPPDLTFVRHVTARIRAALDAPETAPQTPTRTDLIAAYAAHLRSAGDRADAAEAAIERVRALCGRGPGEHNEHQIWIADVLAALDAPSGADLSEPSPEKVVVVASRTHELRVFAGSVEDAREFAASLVEQLRDQGPVSRNPYVPLTAQWTPENWRDAKNDSASRFRRGITSCAWFGPAGLEVRIEDAPAKPRHIGGRANAEDCPACSGTNPPYPFICPGDAEEATES